MDPRRIGAARGVVLPCAALSLALAAGPAPAAAQERPASEYAVVGYGVQPIERLTGSVASRVIRPAEGAPAAHVEELMMGRFAGVEVRRIAGGGFSVRIRGTHSILGSSEPLYVVDGVPVSAPFGPGSALVGISPQDVARIDVLKDAGSTAIYGVRGANGVVIITTRRAETEP